MDDKTLISLEEQAEKSALRKRIKELELEVSKLKLLLKEIDESASSDSVTDAEIICVKQLEILKEHSSKRELTQDEVKTLDILHKNLKIARGEDIRVKPKGKAKKMSTKELEDILKG